MKPVIMQSYSTLEVRTAEGYDPEGTNKEAVTHCDSLYPQLASFENDATGTYLPEVVNSKREQPFSGPPTSHEQPIGRICGLPKRTFYLILAGGILVVIGAIAGGVAGGLAHTQHYTSNHSSDPQNAQDGPDGGSSGNGDGDGNGNGNSTTTNPNVNVLSISKLSSTNRTDANGNMHRTVFFQDTSSAIIARRWDSQNKTWTTSNITESMRGSTSPLNPLPGASMASASCFFNTVAETHLWFLVPDNEVSAVWLSDPDAQPDGWEHDPNYGDGPKTYPGSQIAATWQRGSTGSAIGTWVVAYQTPEGDINALNASNWQSPTTVVEARAVADNSSLGLIPQLLGPDSKGVYGVDRVVLVTESLSSGMVGTMQKNTYIGNWSGDGSLINNIPPPSPSLQFAVTLMNNFTQTMFFTLLPNGTVTALWWGGHFRSIPSINFHSGPQVNFTAIAASEDSMFYGISNDEVLQYRPDDTDLSSFVYVETVYP
ncbi:hypothetical protein F5Y13DRAFT_158804 [Hypoxylon sp. FL1857]|nr:hypothetical protein F5Y13DRAFT_158804 [Hypoxylon sp. FL1857]